MPEKFRSPRLRGSPVVWRRANRPELKRLADTHDAPALAEYAAWCVPAVPGKTLHPHELHAALTRSVPQKPVLCRRDLPHAS